MRYKSKLAILMLAIIPLIGLGQQKDSLVNKLDSLKKLTDTTGQKNLINKAFYDERTKMNGRVFGILLLDDFKQQALSPLDIKGKGWATGAALTATTVGISFLDKPIQRWAVTLRNNNPNSEDISHTITNIGGNYEVITFLGVATYGFVFKNPKLRTTTVLATQAYITSAFWSTLFKTLSGRSRPTSFDLNDPKNTPTFYGPFNSSKYVGNSSFPSGHATLAFAAARVYAMEYKNIPIVPIVSYGVASLVSLSRITENRHWATDIVAGALLGFACGTQTVNNYHRYARLVRTGQFKKRSKKGDLSLNLQYSPVSGLMPGVVYNFR
jgi:membrane-associated phospholipid phosphatase